MWTSGGQYADLGMLLARTDPDVPKHQGISYFAFDMHQPGVDVRPLREMTGHALFNEVFITDARVADSRPHRRPQQRLGRRQHDAHATSGPGLGSGGGNAAGGGMAQPGTVMGMLAKRVGDLVGAARPTGGEEAEPPAVRSAPCAAAPACSSAWPRAAARQHDPASARTWPGCYTLGELGRFNGLRMKAAKEQGGDIPGMPNISKLSMSQIVRLTRDLGLRIVGPAGMLHAYDGRRQGRARRTPPATRFAGGITEMALFAQAPPIYGGTDQVQRNIIGERVLGLPKEPNNDRTTPFSELPKNA